MPRDLAYWALVCGVEVPSEEGATTSMGGRMTAGITTPQRDVLRVLVPGLEAETYLAGGVAVATALHHRISRDLDLFVPHDFDVDRLAEGLSSYP